MKRSFNNIGDAIRDRDAGQATTVIEGIVPYAGDRFPFDSRRNSERTRYLFITASDSDRITFNLILLTSNILLPTPPQEAGAVLLRSGIRVRGSWLFGFLLSNQQARLCGSNTLRNLRPLHRPCSLLHTSSARLQTTQSINHPPCRYASFFPLLLAVFIPLYRYSIRLALF